MYGNIAQMEVDLGEAKNFLVYDKKNMTLTLDVESKMLVQFIGFHPIKLTLRDIRGSIKIKWISIIVERA